jgi:hypothetical protein
MTEEDNNNNNNNNIAVIIIIIISQRNNKYSLGIPRLLEIYMFKESKVAYFTTLFQ